MLIFVEQRHIDEAQAKKPGTVYRGQTCPLALAMREQLGPKYKVNVGSSHVTVEEIGCDYDHPPRWRYSIPNKTYEFIYYADESWYRNRTILDKFGAGAYQVDQLPLWLEAKDFPSL